MDAVFSSNGQITGQGPSVISLGMIKPDTLSTLKSSFYLGQNYPNPFYQNTRIDYSIPVKSKVELILFDLQGRQIKILVNEMKEAGAYYYDLNSSFLSKGLYFYSIHSGNFRYVRKMVVK